MVEMKELYEIPDHVKEKGSIATFEGNSTQFWEKHVIPQIPAVIRAYSEVTEWEGYKWETFSSIAEQVSPDVRVSVEQGAYSNAGFYSKFIHLHEYLKDLDSNQGDPKSGYLAQCQLFDDAYAPHLRQKIKVPSIMDEGKRGEVFQINAWIGPSNTISPLHHDPHDNFLVQLKGEKYVRLYPSNLDVSEVPMVQNNTIPLPIKYLGTESCQETILHRGDLLYIPLRFWHYVRTVLKQIITNQS